MVLPALVALLLVTAPAFALDPSLRMSQYAKRHWHVEDGLPQSYVSSIAQSKDGYLLVGTSGGAVRFDGMRFSPLLIHPDAGAVQPWINIVRADAAGLIWIATRNNGLFRYGEQRTPKVESKSSINFSQLIITRESGILAGGPAGVWRLKEERAERIAQPGSGNLEWNGLLELPDANVLAATSGGLLLVTDAEVRTLLPADAPWGHALSLALGRSHVWVGTSKGLLRAPIERIDSLAPVGGVPGPVVAVQQDRDGVVWAGTWGRGLYRISGEKSEGWTSRDGLADDFVHALFEDGEGSLWIGSRGGLSRWRSGPVSSFGPAEGVEGQFVSAVTGDERGIWLGTWRSGLYKIEGDRVRKVPVPFDEMQATVRSLAAAPDGTLWMSDDWHQQLLCWSRGGWRKYTQKELGYRPAVRTIAVDKQEGLWLGDQRGLFAYPAGKPAMNATRHLPGQVINALLVGRDGRVWAGTAGGLWKQERGSFVKVEGLPHPAVTSLFEDSEGRVWITTGAAGVALATAGGVKALDQRHGLRQAPVHSVLDDGRKAIWLSTSGGILRVPSEQVSELLAGQRGKLDPALIGIDEGMRTIECQNVGQPAAWKDSRGDLWFTTARGLVRVRPSEWRASPEPVVAPESVVSVQRTHAVQFTAPRLVAPERLEFRYRIPGLQQEWVPVGGGRDLRFESLPPGEFQLLIAGRDMGGNWGPPASITLNQPPLFYQTWWFRLGLLSGAAAMLWMAYRWRVFILRARYDAVLMERNRIAREWHDTLVAGFSAISWQLNTGLKRVWDKPASAANALEIARRMVDHYRTEARQVIWDLRRDALDDEHLADAITAALGEIVRGHEIEHSVTVGGVPRRLDPELSRNLMRICQEAALNAVQHGAPTRIDVRLEFSPSQLQIRIADDGSGFEPASVPAGHFGCAIMKERAERFSGHLAVDAKPGAGTVVCAVVPIGKPANHGDPRDA